MAASVLKVPQMITVHLGAPDEIAANITLPYLEYITCTASSELNPTWPNNALLANIYVINSYALNRINNDYYRSQGYDFDITNSHGTDPKYIHGHAVFNNIRDLAANSFNIYVARRGSADPICKDSTQNDSISNTNLPGIDAVSEVNDGSTPEEILKNYFGDDINPMTATPDEDAEPLSTLPLSLGSNGDAVRNLHIMLNRISANFPIIPQISQVNGEFSYDTEAAVLIFQNIFGLEENGVVNIATWATIRLIYNGINRINQLFSEGILQNGISLQFPASLTLGSSGPQTVLLQSILDFLSIFYTTIPPVKVDGVFSS